MFLLIVSDTIIIAQHKDYGCSTVSGSQKFAKLFNFRMVVKSFVHSAQ